MTKATARSKSFIAIDALTHYVQSESWQIRDIHEGIQEADAGEFATDRRVKAAFAKDSPTRAASFVFALQDAVTELRAHPDMGRAGRVTGARELVLRKNYIAVYHPRGDDVELLRLHHVARSRQ